MSLIEVLMLYPETFRYSDYTLTESVEVKVGEAERIDRYKIPEKNRKFESGYVYSMGISLNSKYAEILVRYRYRGAEYTAVASPYFLSSAGLVRENPTGLYVTKYDEVNNDYYVFYTPYRGLPFWDELEVWVIPTVEDVIVSWYSRLFLIFNRDKINEVIQNWVCGVKALTEV